MLKNRGTNREIAVVVFLWSLLIALAIFFDTKMYDSSVFNFVGIISVIVSWTVAVTVGYVIVERNYKIDVYLQLFRASCAIAGLSYVFQHFSNSWKFGYNSAVTMAEMNVSAMQLHVMESGAGILVIVAGSLLLRNLRFPINYRFNA